MTSAPRNRDWTGAEVVVLREHYRGKGAPWCATRLNRTVAAVRKCAARHRLTAPLTESRRPSTSLIDAQIRRAYVEIAERSVEIEAAGHRTIDAARIRHAHKAADHGPLFAEPAGGVA